MMRALPGEVKVQDEPVAGSGAANATAASIANELGKHRSDM